MCIANLFYKPFQGFRGRRAEPHIEKVFYGRSRSRRLVSASSITAGIGMALRIHACCWWVLVVLLAAIVRTAYEGAGRRTKRLK